MSLLSRPRSSLTTDAEQTIADMATRPSSRLTRAQRHGELAVGSGFIAAAVLLAALTDDPRHITVATALTFVVLLAVAARVEIQLRAGCAVPSELVIVPLVLLVPAGLVAPLVALGLVLSRLFDAMRGDLHAQRVLLGIPDAWFVIGPVTVLAVGGVQGVHLGDWPWWCAAFAAQLLADTCASSVSEWLRAGRRPRLFVPDAAAVWFVDAALAPIGLLVALGAQTHLTALLLPLPLIGLIAALAEERRARLEQALDLSSAYRGVALLLGEVIEEDDSYTGEHTRGVVGMAIAVADRLGVGDHERRLVEFGALLHDVGKIHVPNAIINKPGPLSPSEWEIMRRHTLEGEEMLQTVGGLMDDVGVVVRASHERVDGGGYPDGLVGEEIPLAARIVACADGFSAMTTNRSYRRAMSTPEAISELRAHAGTQFDRRVVDALIEVVEAGSTAGDTQSAGLPVTGAPVAA